MGSFLSGIQASSLPYFKTPALVTFPECGPPYTLQSLYSPFCPPFSSLGEKEKKRERRRKRQAEKGAIDNLPE